MVGKKLDAAALRAELELELQWREAELRFMENLMSSLSEDEQAQYRRALVVIIYAHLEGFCKEALSSYAAQINKTKCQVVDADWAIATASLALVFKRLRDFDIKSTLFKSALPDDSQLHRFCREREFLEKIESFEAWEVNIPVEEVVDTESNLKPTVLKKMLYRLGLDTSMADAWSGSLKKLLHWRNSIAHGATKRPIDAKDYKDIKDAWSGICNELMIALFDAARDDAHLRNPSGAAGTGA